MAFPQTAAPTATSFATADSTHNVSMPASVSAGNLLLLLWNAHPDGGSGTPTTPTGWSDMATIDAGASYSAYYKKVADGTESGTTVNVATATNCYGCAQVYKYTAWLGTLAGVEIATSNDGGAASDAPDPPSLSPSWGTADTAWLTGFSGADDDVTPSAYPTGYSNGVTTIGGGGTNNGCEIATARKENASAMENPSTFTLPEVERWGAFTIAISPLGSGGASLVNGGLIGGGAVS